MEITYSPEFPRVLAELGCTLAVSTYQSGKVLLLSSPNGSGVIQFGKSLKRPMGIAVDEHNRMAVACKDTVEVFGTHRKLALSFPKEPRTYDGMFLPRATYYSGQADIHDIEWSDGSLIGVNTAFSCLAKINDMASFEPIWQPSFITDLVPEDRCHLNGLAMVGGTPRYVSLLSQSDEKQGWRKTRLESGLIMDIETEEILVDHLPMPHSPRWIQGRLYFLLSAIGEIYEYDLSSGSTHLFGSVDGFVRGMSTHGNYLFVAISTIRESSKSFKDLPVADKAKYAGIVVFEIGSGKKVAELYYLDRVREIFDLTVIPNMRRGVILDKKGKIVNRAIAVNDETFFWKKEDEQTPPQQAQLTSARSF